MFVSLACVNGVVGAYSSASSSLRSGEPWGHVPFSWLWSLVLVLVLVKRTLVVVLRDEEEICRAGHFIVQGFAQKMLLSAWAFCAVAPKECHRPRALRGRFCMSGGLLRRKVERLFLPLRIQIADVDQEIIESVGEQAEVIDFLAGGVGGDPIGKIGVVRPNGRVQRKETVEIDQPEANCAVEAWCLAQHRHEAQNMGCSCLAGDLARGVTQGGSVLGDECAGDGNLRFCGQGLRGERAQLVGPPVCCASAVRGSFKPVRGPKVSVCVVPTSFLLLEVNIG